MALLIEKWLIYNAKQTFEKKIVLRANIFKFTTLHALFICLREWKE